VAYDNARRRNVISIKTMVRAMLKHACEPSLKGNICRKRSYVAMWIDENYWVHMT
jgi:hypothetical protein